MDKFCPYCGQLMSVIHGSYTQTTDTETIIIPTDSYTCQPCSYVEVYNKSGKLLFSGKAQAHGRE